MLASACFPVDPGEDDDSQGGAGQGDAGQGGAGERGAGEGAGGRMDVFVIGGDLASAPALGVLEEVTTVFPDVPVLLCVAPDDVSAAKVSSYAGAPHVLDLAERFVARGVDVVLSMIHGFPGEDEDSWARMWDLYGLVNRRCSGVTWIVNQFVLFDGTPIHGDPQRVSIRRVGRRLPDNDLQIAFNYECADGSRGFSVKLPERRLAAVRWGLDEAALAELEAVAPATLLTDLHHIDYASFGIAYRNDGRDFLRHDAIEALLGGGRPSRNS